MAQVQSPAARRLLALGNGGHIRGPGTGTSDSIDIKASDGEFILPADTVKKVGVKSLRDLVARTHTPTGKSKPDHYADGGPVDDTQQQAQVQQPQQPQPGAVTRVGNSYSGMDVRGNVSINGQAPGGTFTENAGMRPPSVPAPGATATASISPTAPSIAQPASAQPGAASGRPAAPSPQAAGTATAAAPTAPAQTDWAQRNAQRSLEVTASSIAPSKARDDAQAQLDAASRAASGNAPAGTPAVASAAPRPNSAPSAGGEIIPPPRRPPVRNVMENMNLAVPRFADGGLVAVDEQRQGLRGLAERLAQIPTDGYPQAPVADGSQDSAWNTDAGRNVANTINALPGTGSMLKSGRMVGAAAQSLSAAREVGAANAAIAAGRAFTAPALGAVSLSSAGSTERPAVPSANAPPAAANRAADLGHYNEGELMGPPGEAMPLRATATGPAPAPAQPSGNGAGNEAYSRLLALATASPPPPPAVQAPIARHSGNDWQARKDLQNLATGASSIMNRPEYADAGMGRFRGGSGHAGSPPAVAAYQAALQTDAALRSAQPGLDSEAVRQNAALAREAMEQRGSGQRAILGALASADSNQVARGRLTLEQIAAGYQNRSAARLETAQQAVENAQTPAEQRNARQRLLTLLGKDGEDRWKSVALQGGTDAQGNKTESILGAVNERTGEMRRMPTQTQPAAAPADGSMVRGKDGRLYEVKNGQPVLVGG